MSARVSRRTLLAGLAAMPTLALVGCEPDRTAAGPISTTDTLDFANQLRITALAESTLDDNGVRVFRLSAISGSAEFLPRLSTPAWSYTDGRYDAGYLGPTLRAIFEPPTSAVLSYFNTVTFTDADEALPALSFATARMVCS